MKKQVQFVDNIVRLDPKELICLVETKHVTGNDPIVQLYKDNQTEVDEVRGVISIMNSIVHQRRFFFVMTYRSLPDLVREDKNWKRKIRVGRKLYYKILKTAHESGILETVTPGVQGKHGTIYRLVEPQLVKYLDFTEDEKRIQYDQATGFISRREKRK